MYIFSGIVLFCIFIGVYVNVCEKKKIIRTVTAQTSTKHQFRE